MGNCVACNEGPSNELVELGDSNSRKNTDYQYGPNGSSLTVRSSELGSNGRVDSVVNGSCNTNQHHGSGDMSNSFTSQKSEKKAFYNRIPPLGRVGSADRDRKAAAQNAHYNASIVDNNNAYSDVKITSMFEHYKDPYEDSILAEGIERICRDLELKPEDFKILVLAWKCGAEQMCRFTREEYFGGMRALKTDSVQGIRQALIESSGDALNDATQFKDLYRFAFKFALDSDLGQRILPVDMAISLWRVVFALREPPVLNRWFRFLEAHPLIRGIPRDTWNMFLNFVETVGNDLSTYDDTEAWPSLFDDFVEYENELRNQHLKERSSAISPKD